MSPDHPIWEMWLRLTEYYGSAFTHEPEPTATWIYHLQDLSAEQIGNGIRNLIHHDSEFAPNPGQFKDLCLADFDWERRAHKPASEVLGIESKSHLTDANRAAGEDFFKQLNKGWAQ